MIRGHEKAVQMRDEIKGVAAESQEANAWFEAESGRFLAQCTLECTAAYDVQPHGVRNAW